MGGRNKVSIVSLNETWLRHDTESKFDIPGYNYVGKLRKGRKGGGVCLLLSEEITFRQIDIFPEFETLELICVEIKMKCSSIITVSLYRPPNQLLATSIAEITKCFEILKSQKKATIVCTDHNLDYLKANSHPHTQELLETLTEYGYVSTITKPTRVTHSSATLIDNVLLNKELSIDYISWLLLEDISDHFPCLISIKNFVPDRKTIGHILKRRLDKNATDLIKHDITRINWSSTLCNLTCDESLNEFHDNLMRILDIHAPECSVHKKSKISVQPWVNKGIKRCLHKQKRLYSQWLAERSNAVLHEKYLAYKSCLQKLLRNVKKDYYSQLCMKHMTNSKKLWGIINSYNKAYIE